MAQKASSSYIIRKEQVNNLKKVKLIRGYLYRLFPDIAQLRTEINRNNIHIYLSIPEINLVLGEDGKNATKIVKELNRLINDDKVSLHFNLIEVKNVYANAQAVANLMASQIKKRLPIRQIFRNLISKIKLSTEKFREKIKGGSFEVRGILDDSGIAQTKKEKWGKLPLSTIDSNIEIGRQEAIIPRGKVGIKIILYKGKIWQKKKSINQSAKLANEPVQREKQAI
ncbi:15113_t:CDS:2 [Racocetra persica]|uniref:15113_t:CDS:1 n=1 Tax=Racocetra persica TaxID=160502 RepID=A0ACA9L615_9GLOM|nr:15113_t:CDS:2 [Racocetra persica]